MSSLDELEYDKLQAAINGIERGIADSGVCYLKHALQCS